MMHFLKKLMLRSPAPRGFTLLIALILTTVILSVGLALLDISFKQVTLAAASRQSQYAFYNADSGLECALYYDSLDTFDYANLGTSGSISCEGQSFNYSDPSVSPGVTRTITFTVPCAGDPNDPPVGSDGSAFVTITKAVSPQVKTHFYANGYNTCVAASPQRVERGEEATY